MAFVSRISTLTFNGATGNRSWVATAAVQDTAAGSSVIVTTTQTFSGATPPGQAETLTLRVKNEAGTVIRTFALTVSSASQTSEFFFTNDGTNTGTARAGTLIIDIQATRTTVVSYDYETDGSPSTAPTGFTATVVDRGWIRGSTTSTLVLSNASLGGAKNTPAEYDESLFARVTLAATLYEAKALTVALSNTSPALSSTTNSATSGNFDVTFTAVVDERYPAASSNTATTTTSPNSANTGTAYVPLTPTEDSMTADPRLTLSHYFHKDQTSFDTSFNVLSKQMLSSEVGQAATRFVGSRGTGINGLSVTQTVDPTNPGTTVTANSTTATLDSEAGWTGLVDVCPTGKPGGPWVKTCDVTAPTDIDLDSYLITNTDTLTVLAPDSRITPIVYLGPSATGTEGRHAEPGENMKLVVTMYTSATHKRLAADAGSVTACLIRWNVALSRFEYLDSDGTTWINWTTSLACNDFSLADAGDGVTFTVDFNSTSGWTAADIVAILLTSSFTGTPYTTYVSREFVSSSNRHDGYAFDPTKLFK